MNISRRTVLAGLSALAVAPLAAACGTDSSTAPAGPSGTGSGTGTGSATGAESAAFPVSIEHKFGTTEITEAPTRVVCVGLTEQDALIALGVKPVGVTYWFGDKELQGIYPWAQDAYGDGELPVLLDATNGTPVEKVAALAPDLIIGQYAGITQQEYDLLSKIAPTVAQPAGVADYGAPWQQATLNVGTAIGKATEARALIDDVEKQIADNALSDVGGKTAACVTPYEGLFVYGAQDVRGQILGQLGFDFPDQLIDPDATEFGWSLSAERTSDLAGVDTVVWFDYDTADQGMKDLFEATDTYREGRWFSIDNAESGEAGAYYVAISFVTPLSIPYVLERYVPQLTAAVDGDPKTTPETV